MHQEKEILLPAIYDPEGDSFTVVVKVDGSTTMPVDFVSYDYEKSTFKIAPKEIT
jgi:hypothetical protein